MSYSSDPGPTSGLTGSVCSVGGMIQFDILPPLVMGAAASFPLHESLDAPFLNGQTKMDFPCIDPPSSGGFVALACCSVGTWKIGDDGVVVLRNTEVLKAGN